MSPCIIVELYHLNNLVIRRAARFDTFNAFIKVIKRDLSVINEFVDKYMQQYGGFRHFDIDNLNAAIKYSEENNCLDRYFKIGCETNVMLVVQVIPTEISLIY
jgi:hypothetical protein